VSDVTTREETEIVWRVN